MLAAQQIYSLILVCEYAHSPISLSCSINELRGMCMEIKANNVFLSGENLVWS